MSIEELPTGPKQITRRVVVGAPASTLFEQLADPHLHGGLDGSGTLHGGVKGPHRLGLGDRFSMKMKQFGVPYRITSTVVELVPDRRIAWKHPLGHVWRWELEEVAPGRTQVTETWDGSGSPAYPVLKATGLMAKSGQGIEATLQGLAARYS